MLRTYSLAGLSQIISKFGSSLLLTSTIIDANSNEFNIYDYNDANLSVLFTLTVILASNNNYLIGFPITKLDIEKFHNNPGSYNNIFFLCNITDPYTVGLFTYEFIYSGIIVTGIVPIATYYHPNQLLVQYGTLKTYCPLLASEYVIIGFENSKILIFAVISLNSNTIDYDTATFGGLNQLTVFSTQRKFAFSSPLSRKFVIDLFDQINLPNIDLCGPGCGTCSNNDITLFTCLTCKTLNYTKLSDGRCIC
jgi:hypothetical protein